MDREDQTEPATAFCANFVIVQQNVRQIRDFAVWLAPLKPRVVNFINFNPHHEWANNPETLTLVADLRLAHSQWTEAIQTLEDAGCGVNLRYYPMCSVPEKYRRCVCNDLHVMFDSGEWDYGVMPKTVECYEAVGRSIHSSNEEQGRPCSGCSIREACGGAIGFGMRRPTASSAKSSSRSPHRLSAVRGLIGTTGKRIN